MRMTIPHIAGTRVGDLALSLARAPKLTATPIPMTPQD